MAPQTAVCPHCGGAIRGTTDADRRCVQCGYNPARPQGSAFGRWFIGGMVLLTAMTVPLMLLYRSCGSTAVTGDTRHVDLVEAIRQTRAVVRKKYPQARLASLAIPEVTGGLVNLGDHSSATRALRFEWTSSGVWVLLKGTKIEVQDPVATDPIGFDVPDPRCSSSDAWSAVVRSGAAEGALADWTLFTPDESRSVWIVQIKGGSERSYTVDAKTCAVLAR